MNVAKSLASRYPLLVFFFIVSLKTVSLGDRPLTKPDGYARSRSAGISSIPLFDKSVIDSRALSSSPRNPSCGRRGPGPSDSQISRSQISQATHSGLGILTSHKVFVFIVFSFRASVALLSLPNVICGRRLGEAGKSQPRGANESLNPALLLELWWGNCA